MSENRNQAGVRETRKGTTVENLLLSLLAGLLIGAIFKFIKLPVPVPHGLGGLIGLFGMFLGSELVGYLTRSAGR